MVNPGGESTMLGQWRIVLRQAEEAARLGRFEEAYALANSAGRGGPPSCGPVPQPAGAGLDCPGDAARRRSTTWPGRSKTWTWPSGLGHRLTRWPRLASTWPTGSPTKFASTLMPASRSACSGARSKSWHGTRSVVRRLRRTREIAEAWQIGAGRRAAR